MTCFNVQNNRILPALLGVSLCLIACEQKSVAQPAQEKAKAPEVAPKAVKSKPAQPKPETKTAKATDAQPQKFADRPFKISYVTPEAKAGQLAVTAIKIEPLDGYKMNKDFPNTLTIDPAEKMQFTKSNFETADGKLTEAALTYGVPFKGSNSGEYALTGKTNFSVCNERTCKLYRGEKLAWTVTVK